MSRDYIRLRATADRERRLEEAKAALRRADEVPDSESKVIDAGLVALTQLVEIMDEQQEEMRAQAEAVSGDALSLGVCPSASLRSELK